MTQFLSEQAMAQALGDQFWKFDDDTGRLVNTNAPIAKTWKKPEFSAREKADKDWKKLCAERSLPTANQVILAAASATGISVEMLMVDCRKFRVSAIRHATVQLIYEISGKSFPWVGAQIGRDHTTVVNSVTRNAKKLDVLEVKSVILAALRVKFPSVDERMADVRLQRLQSVAISKRQHVNK